MPGHSTLFHPGEPRNASPRAVRDVVAVLYRQAGLIVLCVLLGTAASLVLYMRQPRVYVSTARVWFQTNRQGPPVFFPAIAADRETPYPDAVEREMATEIALMLTRSNAQAVVQEYAIDDSQLVHGGVAKPRAERDAASAAMRAPDRRSKTVDFFLDGVSVEPLRSKTPDTSPDVLEVKFESTDRTLAPVALQSFLDNYLRLGAQQDRRFGETTSRRVQTQLVQAGDELRQSEDRIVALLVQDGGRSVDDPALTADGSAQATAAGRLRLDLNPEAPLAVGGSTPVVAALKARTLALQLRLDEARQLSADDTGNVRNLRLQLAGSHRRLASTVRENTQLEDELDRLALSRQLAQERFVELQRQLDQIDLSLRMDPPEAESRVIIDAPDHPTAAEGRKTKMNALQGPIAGLLLGLLLAGFRELGGERMRSPSEAEWALGVPVLGAIPTLSAKARNTYLGSPPPPSVPNVAPTEPA